VQSQADDGERIGRATKYCHCRRQQQQQQRQKQKHKQMLEVEANETTA
jgi:hypothetical protein